MAVQAQFGSGCLAGCLPIYGGVAGAGVLADEQMRALMSAAAGNKAFQYDSAAGVASAAQSELTCNGNGGGAALPSRKRGRIDDEFEQFVTSSSAALLPIPVMQQAAAPAAITANRMAYSAVATTSGRAASPAEDVIVAELYRHGAKVDAMVRGECERLRATLEQAHKRQRQAVARAAAAGAARLLRAKDAELEAARRRAVELEDRLRQAVAESQAWCGVARSNEAVATGLRAALDALLLHGGAGGVGVGSGATTLPAEEGFGDSDPVAEADDDDAESRCFVEAEDAGAETSSPAMASRWACRGCGGGEASVLLLPCRHLCLCKACEPRAEACPVCLAAKNGAIHVAAAN